MSPKDDVDAAVSQQTGYLKAVLRGIDAALPGQMAALHASLHHLSRLPKIAEAAQRLAEDAEQRTIRRGRRDA